MKIVAQPFRNTYIVEPQILGDARGRFIKIFHEGLWRELGLPVAHVAEEFWSTSAKGVLRGMHFQTPPHDHAKTVTCLAGRVLDVLLDLRKGEPTFGQAWAGELASHNARVTLIPKGVAHGFLSLEDASLLLYKVSAVHSPEHDCGVRWNSFGYSWPVNDPIISPRDQTFPGLLDYRSPF